MSTPERPSGKDEVTDRLDELVGRVHDINERVTMTFLDVRRMEGTVTRIDNRLEHLDTTVDRETKKREAQDRKLDQIMRSLGIPPQ